MNENNEYLDEILGSQEEQPAAPAQPEQPAASEQPTVPEQPAAPEVQLGSAMKKIPWKIVGIAAAAVAVVAVLIIIIASVAGGGASKPIDKAISALNDKDLTLNERIEAHTNGYLASECKEIVEIISGIDGYEDVYDNFEDSWAERVEYYEDEYGDNYKFSFETEEETELKKKDLKEYKEGFQSLGESLKAYAKNYKDLKKSEREDFAEELDVEKSVLDDLADLIDGIGTELAECTVDEGRSFELLETVTGSELDDPEEDYETVETVKLNGKWIEPSSFSMVISDIIGYAHAVFGNI